MYEISREAVRPTNDKTGLMPLLKMDPDFGDCKSNLFCARTPSEQANHNNAYGKNVQDVKIVPVIHWLPQIGI